MKKEDIEDYIMLAISGICIAIPSIVFGWFAYKVAKGAYHLIDKLIDKI